MRSKGSPNGPSDASGAEVYDFSTGRKLEIQPATTREAEELAKEIENRMAIAEADAVCSRIKDKLKQNSRLSVSILLKLGVINSSDVIEKNDGSLFVKTPDGLQPIKEFYMNFLNSY